MQRIEKAQTVCKAKVLPNVFSLWPVGFTFTVSDQQARSPASIYLPAELRIHQCPAQISLFPVQNKDSSS